MKIIIHDLMHQDFTSIYQEQEDSTIVISDNGEIHNCIGCFGCWIKTPGKCVLKDAYNNMGELLSKCDELIIISKCVYGSYSSFIRNVFDRSISYLLPYFEVRNNETNHQKRYNNKIKMIVHFYGNDITKNEQETAKALVTANGINFHSLVSKVYFHESLQAIKGGVQ
ncbi:flavodoxin family protein [Clostridium paridis]|uniref:Flavodoxin family protein n=1 Tax=Clostridium paridis TaxID=2803863 RepID=A0A937FF53_9CLOT|nr:flavodoxin family protein [Clostridium paridis]MBL4930436.1 flavodoxin family protein [Clostridium paridis]